MVEMQNLTDRPLKNVIWQIRYPNIFYIDSKIGDFQSKIIDILPKSDLQYKVEFEFRNKGLEVNIKKNESNPDVEKKTWIFKSKDEKISLEITYNSFTISSSKYKSYAGEESFKELINSLVSSFSDVMMIKLINRLGFRYINKFIIKPEDKLNISNNFSLKYPISDFDKINEYFLRYISSEDTCSLISQEVFSSSEDKKQFELWLDFDAFKEDFDSNNLMKNTDELHLVIFNKFFNSLTEEGKKLI